ncbi:MAG: MerR family transcriptional regulator [Actinomycetia bacterium]|nr:MerR family transcriptional regulator [Actinomycetes bacterium]
MPAARSPSPEPKDGARLTIGKVIALLAADFPELSVSKVRFLEAEGLLTPVRSGSGYRRYSEADVERLRFILTAQRDHFWPLKVIAEALQDRDRGLATVLPAAPTRQVRLSAPELEELAVLAGGAPGLVDALLSAGLVSADGTGRFGAADQRIVEAVAGLSELGLEARHLRPFRAAADREVGLIEQMMAGERVGGRDRTARATQLAHQLLNIHSALVAKGIDDIR